MHPALLMEEVATRVLGTYSLERHGMERNGNVERNGKGPHLVLAALHSAEGIVLRTRIEDPLVISGKDRNISKAGPASARENGLVPTIGTKKEGGSLLGSAPEKYIAMPLAAQISLLDSSLYARQLACASACSAFYAHKQMRVSSSNCTWSWSHLLSKPPCLPEDVIVLQSS